MLSRRSLLVGWAIVIASVGASGCAPPLRGDAASGAAQPAGSSQDAGATANAGGSSTAPVTTGARIEPQAPPQPLDACATRTRDGWCWVTPRPQGNWLADLSSPIAGEAWAVGGNGTVLRGVMSPAGSVEWTLVDAGISSDLTAVSEATDGTVFIGSSTGGILRGDAAAGGWTNLPAPGLTRVTGLWAASHDDAWAVGNEATVYHWTGSGDWTAANVGPDAVTAVVGRAANDVWMASEIGHSIHWDGTTFTRGDIAIQQRSGFDSSRNDLYFSRMGVLDDGTLWAAAKSLAADGGCWALSAGTWLSVDAYTIAGASLADHWASGAMGSVIHVSPLGPDAAGETDLGASSILAGHQGDLWAIAGASARHNTYGSWNPVTTYLTPTPQVHVTQDGDAWMTGLLTSDGSWLSARWNGQSWSLFPMAQSNPPSTVVSSGSQVWMAGTSLWYWDGTALQELPYPHSPPFPSAGWSARSLVVTPTALWILGAQLQPGGGGDALLRYDGARWRWVALPAGYMPDPDDSRVLGGTSDHDLWLLTRLTVYHYDGQTWSAPTVLPGSGAYGGIHDIRALAPQDVWAGTFHFDGASWIATAAPDSFGAIWSVWADSDAAVFAMTSTGLYRWDGSSWSDPLPLPTDGTWYGISAANASDLWIAGPGGILHGGPSWPLTIAGAAQEPAQ